VLDAFREPPPLPGSNCEADILLSKTPVRFTELLLRAFHLSSLITAGYLARVQCTEIMWALILAHIRDFSDSRGDFCAWLCGSGGAPLLPHTSSWLDGLSCAFMQNQGWYSCYLTMRVDDVCFFVYTGGFLNTVQARYHSCFVSRTFNCIQI
jgi:hypothetical protein